MRKDKAPRICRMNARDDWGATTGSSERLFAAMTL